MRPILLDANAILRYLLNDISEQADKTAEAIADGAEITLEILAECVFVMCSKKVYGIARSVAVDCLDSFLDEVVCARKGIARAALSSFANTNLDFADCILYAESVVESRKVLTFDKKLQQLLGDAAV